MLCVGVRFGSEVVRENFGAGLRVETAWKRGPHGVEPLLSLVRTFLARLLS